MDNHDGDNDSTKVKKAKNAVNNGVNSGKIKKPDKCRNCGKKTSLEAHHHKGYDEENMTNVVWLCPKCHRSADAKLRNKKCDSYRFDRIDAPEWLIDEFKSDNSSGFLIGRANVTNIGVFEYRNQDGSIRRELRLPEHVLDGESVATLRMKPLTNDHPAVLVTSDNIKDYQVGTTGGSPATDGMHLTIDMSVTDAKTIQDIQNGKQELSAGYTVDMLEESGVWMGIAYDAIQTNIRYNHVAIVDRARAGDAARIKLRNDSADAICIGRIENKKEDTNMSDKTTIKIDGMDVQVEPLVGAHINRISSRADNLEKDKGDLEGKLEVLTKEHETLKGKFDGVTEQLKKSADIAPEKLQEAIKKRLVILDAASLAKLEVKEDHSDRAIKEAVIMATFPREDEKAYKESLKDLSDDYINGKFDTAHDELKIQSENKKKNDANQAPPAKLPGGEGDGIEDTLEELRRKNDAADKEFNKRLSMQWDKGDK